MSAYLALPAATAGVGLLSATGCSTAVEAAVDAAGATVVPGGDTGAGLVTGDVVAGSGAGKLEVTGAAAGGAM
jgi:hypothetical protein